MITASAADRPRRVFSRFYAKISERMEAEGMTALRAALLDDLAGEVVEIGAGNGLNFAHYPPRVTRVVAVEPEPHLRGLAVRTAAAAPCCVWSCARSTTEPRRWPSCVACFVPAGP